MLTCATPISRAPATDAPAYARCMPNVCRLRSRQSHKLLYTGVMRTNYTPASWIWSVEGSSLGKLRGSVYGLWCGTTPIMIACFKI